MSLKKAIEIYKSLSTEQKELVKTKKIRASFSVRKWLVFLNKVSIYDRLADEAREKAKKSTILFFVLAGVVAFLHFFLYIIAFILFPLLILFVVLGFMSRSKRLKLEHNDLNNYMRFFFYPLLEVMKDKAGEEAKISASLDFREPRTGIEPELGKVNERNLKHYHTEIIKAKIPLKDGASLELSLIDDIKDFTYWKTSASGKRKFKSKSKIIHQYSIRLTVPKASYPHARPQGTDEILLELTDDAYVLKFKGKHKVDAKEHLLPLKSFFQTIESMYECIQGPPKRKSEGEEDAEVEELETLEVYEDDTLPFVLWTGGYFDDYDYDSVHYSESIGDGAYMDEEGGSVFDS